MHRNTYRLRRGLMATAACLVLSAAVPALAAPLVPSEASRAYDLKSQPLAKALSEVARVSGRQVVVSSSLVRGKTAPALQGRYTADEAYAALLSGSGLKITPVGATLVVQPLRGDTPATGEPQAGDAEVLSELVVTGTRIRGEAPVGSTLISITRKDIDASGYASTQELLQALPQNYAGGASEGAASLSSRNGAAFNGGFGTGVNLRGLGNTSTLVLINGDRPAMGGVAGSFADLSLIPSTAIDHIEALADGASALYGSDAVAGVVNIVLRDRLDGGEARMRYGTADGDFSEVQASVMRGRVWERGYLTFAYEYLRRGRLAADDRAFAREDLRPFGGLDRRTGYASPGTIVAGGRNFAIPAGQNGVGLTAARLGADQVNRTDARLGADILPRQTRQSIYLSGGVDLDASTTLSARILGADRRYDLRRTPTWASQVTVPVSNPFYVDPLGARQPVRVQYRFADDLGAERSRGHISAVNGGADLTRRIGTWSVTGSAGYGREEDVTGGRNIVNTYRLNLALADTNPATAYNLFGGPRSTHPSTIDAIRGWTKGRGLYTVWTAGLKGDGELFDLPAGPLKLAVGYEHRSERYRNTSITYQTTADQRVSPVDYPGVRRIEAVYGELRAPLIGEGQAIPGVHRLDLSLAGRIEDYSDFGRTSNPKIGVNLETIAGLTLKGAYGTSFRAPSFQDQRLGPGLIQYFPFAVIDPKSPTGKTNVLFLLGNTPGIQPERAKTWTAGLEWRPPAAQGLRLNAGYFRVEYSDRIGAPNADALNMLINRDLYRGQLNETPSAGEIAGYYASPYLSNTSGIAAADIKAIANARTQNLSSLVQDGIDLDLAWQGRLRGDPVGLGVSGSYTFRVDKRFTAGSPSTDQVNTVGNPLKLRVRGRGSWSHGPWDLAAAVNVAGGYTNQTVSPARSVSSWTTVDLNVSYRLPEQDGLWSGVRLTLSASNLFDKDPPFVESVTPSSAIGFDTDNASAIGRVVAVTVIKPW
ncbi:TonB-dependent receptor [Caulobacter sp. Root342]|uniref:TonB-dependent receptor n=1 Tax=Caulobacter sp. Root342 TaxID=1736519 RepID=UPI0006F40C23|nr:TonB-dependent receptor [Caulobacter sp. Root342]KQV54659.1 TonB-dependent receptor [Caulobacter sp. Root342]